MARVALAVRLIPCCSHAPIALAHLARCASPGPFPRSPPSRLCSTTVTLLNKRLARLPLSSLQLLLHDVPVRRGLLLLGPGNAVLLGGQVERMEAARQRAVAAWNKPVGRWPGRNLIWA